MESKARRLYEALERSRNWIDTSMGKAKPSQVREIVAYLDSELDIAKLPADGE